MNTETNKHAIKLLDEVYSIVINQIYDKESNKLYRISEVQNILNMIDELQYNINNY